MQRYECEKAIWYLIPITEIGTIVEKLSNDIKQNSFKQYELKLDTPEWSHVSPKYVSFNQTISALKNIANASLENKDAIVSLRLFFTDASCRWMMATNPARHRCKVCVQNYVPLDATAWKPLPDTKKMQFSCSTMGDIIENARQTQEHLSRVAQHQDGDGTFYAQTSIIKPRDPPGQSLLQQALRVARGEKADGSDTPSDDILHPPNKVFTNNRYALIPHGAMPNEKQPDKRLRQDNARRYGCPEDEYDIERRQLGNWYEQHFSGNLSREDYFIATAQEKGISKFDIVEKLVDQN